jgi:exopolysaccharide biosynthesis polyprenyl glycosylphosphotransferase
MSVDPLQASLLFGRRANRQVDEPSSSKSLPRTWSGSEIGKRVLDLLGALLLALLTLPLCLVVALAVRLDSPGPVFYPQVRLGRSGRPFHMLKFRSMVADAEADGRAQWAIPDDPRVTKVGRVIRRYRFDELPQLWNVLRGEMSLVGPRPERPELAQKLAAMLPAYELRHQVKPGLTGWAQIKQGYTASAEEATEKLRLDLYYVANQGLAMDLLILARTVRIVLTGDGAR